MLSCDEDVVNATIATLNLFRSSNVRFMKYDVGDWHLRSKSEQSDVSDGIQSFSESLNDSDVFMTSASAVIEKSRIDPENSNVRRKKYDVGEIVGNKSEPSDVSDGIQSPSACASLEDWVFMNSAPEGIDTSMIDPEFQKTVENIETVNQMCAHLEKLCNSENSSDAETYVTNHFADLIQPSKLGETIEKLENVVNHMQTIVAEESKLKRVLRSSIVNDIWPINRDHHKFVIRFFHLASDLVKNIDALIIALESGRKISSDKLKIMQNNQKKLLQVLCEVKDSLQDLRNFVRPQHSI